MRPEEVDTRVPVIAVAGTRDEGRSRWLRRLLENDGGRTAVVTDSEQPVPETQCACCAAPEALAESLRSTVRGRGHIGLDRLVVEVGDDTHPAAALGALDADPFLAQHTRAAAVACTIDARRGADLLTAWDGMREQLCAADLVVITGSELADPATVSALAAQVSALNPVAGMEVGESGRDSLDRLTDADCAPDLGTAVSGGELAVGEVRSSVIRTEDEHDWAAFALWLDLLLHRHGENVLKTSGRMPFTGVGPVEVRAIGRLPYPPRRLAEPLPGGEGRLVFVTRKLDPVALRRSFSAFMELGSRS